MSLVRMQARVVLSVKHIFEHPDYVPLLERAYKNWNTLEQETGEELYFKTGLLYAGTSNNEMIKGIKRSAALYNIEVEKLNTTDAANRFPQFSLPGNFEA